MAPLPPPQGMSEADYETIEAAVTETVRGRWFLGEFARRNRTGEMKQLLDAMSRVESVVATAAAPALPPADPSIRLLMQRIKEVSAQLEGLSSDMRAAGLDAQFAERIEHQARAVAGMMRGPGRDGAPPQRSLSLSSDTMQRTVPPPPRATLPPAARLQVPAIPATAVLADDPGPAEAAAPGSNETRPTVEPMGDPRLAALSALDSLSLAKKLALFS